MNGGMRVRRYAAIELVRRGQLDPELALSFVVWPSPALGDELIPEGRRLAWAPEVVAEARRLSDEGWTKEAVGKMLGVSQYTVKGWIRARGKTGGSRRRGDPSLVA